MPAFIWTRRTSVFSVLLGFVFGFSLVFCFTSLQYCATTWKLIDKASERVTTSGVFTNTILKRYSQNSKEQIICEDKSIYQSFKQRGDYWVLYNYIVGSEQVGCAESITYATHGDYTFLDNLPILIERWQGPISIALYAPGYDFHATLDSIAYLRRCETPLISKFVNFHIFFGNRDFPEVGDVALVSKYNDTYNCSDGPPYLNTDKEKTYKKVKNLMYPINVARNVARETAQTHFVFSSDIELYPTRALIPKFLDMVLDSTNSTQNSVFVLPIFEVSVDQEIPETKAELQEMIKNKTAFVFHEKLCLPCHKVPGSDEWLQQSKREGLNVFSSAKREGKYKYWEPFYIGTNEDPLFDERLTWEGQSNKMSQGYIMCLLNYTYLVLDNAFLIHKPGIKKSKDQLRKHGNIVRSTNKMLHEVIKAEIDTIYGKNEECYLR